MSDVFDKLKILTAADTEPSLTETEIGLLVEMFGTPDSEGRGPKNPEWQPTCDLNAAAAEGWRIKAGKISHEHDVTVDSQDFAASQKFSQCMEMAERYAKKVKGSFSAIEPQRR